MLILAAVLSGCDPHGESANQASDITGASAIAAPDMIIHGGPIYTGLENPYTVDAVTIANGVIVATGDDTLMSNAGPDTEIIDLGGSAMYPGFVDSHAHFLAVGQREMILNLEGVGSIAELVSIIAANAQRNDESGIIYGRGWIETGWPEARMPTRDDLDAVSASTPVILTRADGHAMVVNSAALKAAGIDATTPDPDGGRIERDSDGRATGILVDRAQDFADALIAAPNEDQKREAYRLGSQVYAGYGWTGMHSMSVDPNNVPLIESLSDSGDVGIRIYNSVEQTGLESMAGNGGRQSENGRIITRAVKLYVDGALGSRGALLSEPYADQPETSGLLLIQKDDAIAIFERALDAGVQINTHAIGDEGNRRLLNWYEETFANHGDIDNVRWRIEHSQILHTDDIPRFAQLGVIASMQPSHAIGDLFFAPDRLGPNRLDGAYAWRSLIDAGAIIAAGSDAPVERGDPLIEFYAAVARRGLDGTQTADWRPSEAVTRDEALRMFTAWPAYASFQDETLGAIEPGKRADFTVFSKDIMSIPEADILSAKPVLTIVDGDIIFRAR